MKDDAQKRGTKRKRFEPLKQKDIGTKIAGKLHHDLKEVRKAAKKAKTFETQKLVKKIKGLRSKSGSDPIITECETQLEQLRLINHEAVANTALRTKLTKDKILSDHESIQTALSKELTDNLLVRVEGGTAAAKIQSRLLSSKILASEVAATVEDLRSVINPNTDYSQDGDVSAEMDESLSERPLKVKKMERISEDGDVEMDLADVDEEPVEVGEDDDGWESGTVGDDEKENGWESGSIAGESNEYMDEDPPSDTEEALQNPSTKLGPVAGPSKSNAKAPAGHSTFLPTLSTGFVRGSDSDWSEDEDKVADLGERKNRRGQRARQRIWEKKFGRNANHKKKEAAANAVAETERGRKRWSDRLPHKPGQETGRRPQTHGVESAAQPKQQDSGWGQRGATAINTRDRDSQPMHPPVASSTRDRDRDSRPLHPSWEAKKRLSERQSAAIVPMTGKKIKFS